jgi:hypothetical protein
MPVCGAGVFEGGFILDLYCVLDFFPCGAGAGPMIRIVGSARSLRIVIRWRSIWGSDGETRLFQDG